MDGTQVVSVVDRKLRDSRLCLISPKVRVFVPGEPQSFLTPKEAAWKETIRAAFPGQLVQPRLAFVVSSFLRGGHRFDLDNIAKPVLDVVAVDAESVWVTVEQGAVPGVMISEEAPPPPPPGARVVAIAAPPIRSIRSAIPLHELAGLSLVGRNEALGIHLRFRSQAVRVGNFGFEGPIKPLIDALYPILGGKPHAPADHRIKELRAEKRPGAGGVTVSLWSVDP